MKKVKSLLVSGLLVSLSFSMSYAGHFSGGFASGKLTYGVRGGDSSIVRTAASQWNGVSSKAGLTYSSATDKYGLKANIVTYANSHSSPTAGLLGQTIPYKSYTGTSATPASVKDRWVKAIVYQYKTSNLNTTAKKIHTMTHEFGHALSVAHPSNSSTDAVMKQGAQTTYNLKSYDKSSLKAKWGR